MAKSLFNSQYVKLLQRELIEHLSLVKKMGLRITQEKLHLNERELFFKLSTLRNRNLISDQEQQQLAQSVGAFFGMSVGSHAVTTWVLESKANEVRIADPDVISGSNLNRIKCGWEDVGRKKVEVVSETLRKLQPFITLVVSDATGDSHLKTLLTQPTTVDFIVDEIDDLLGKIVLREYARKLRVPLVSAADVGDMVVIDVERHDLESECSFFLGRIPEYTAKDLAQMSELERKQLIIQLVGTERNSERMMESLLAIGTTIPTWPQLGATASISGGIVAAVLRKMILGEKINSGRYYFSLDELLVADYFTKQRVQKRASLMQTIAQLFSRR
jgi:molybdopterin/thiamine biosynthesis adenylyltransferase